MSELLVGEVSPSPSPLLSSLLLSFPSLSFVILVYSFLILYKFLLIYNDKEYFVLMKYISFLTGHHLLVNFFGILMFLSTFLLILGNFFVSVPLPV